MGAGFETGRWSLFQCPLSTHCGRDSDRRSSGMTNDSLKWLMQWYVGQCDNDWEHTYGVEIGTLDNPGWSLKVDLTDTALEGRSFDRVTHGEPAEDLDEWRRTGSWWVADVQ